MDKIKSGFGSGFVLIFVSFPRTVKRGRQSSRSVHVAKEDPTEKRQGERVVKDLKISYTLIASVEVTPFEFGDSVMTDISRAGLAMLAESPIPVGMLLQMRLLVPSTNLSLFVLGRTVYCRAMEKIGKYRVGIRFVGLLPQDLEEVLNEFRRTHRDSSRS